MNTENITVNTQSSIRIVLDKTIYFDPFKIENDIHDADIIFITHSHYDHFDLDSINNIKNSETIVVAPASMKEEINNIKFNDYVFLNTNEDIEVNGINIKTIPAYNNEKSFHPRENNWLGYVITYNNISYYIAGDTDKTEEAEKVKCDIAFIPIGGYYTMNVSEASELIKIMKPKVVIPIHYGSIIGNREDGLSLKERLTDTNIDVVEKIIFD